MTEPVWTDVEAFIAWAQNDDVVRAVLDALVRYDETAELPDRNEV